MDRNSIRENNTLEQYLLGTLPNDQYAEVSLLLKKDEVLRAELQILEESFESMAFENAEAPPERIKKALMESVFETQDQKVISLPTTRKTFPSLAIAASLAVLFMLSSGWLYYRLNGLENRFNTLQNEAATLNNQLVDIQKNYTESNKWLQAINQPNTLKYVMQGNEILPNSTVVSYVNHQTKEVILNTEGLPDLKTDQDYQLWADVEGVMVNMGVIPEDEEIVAMKYIEDAHSLNITIEPAGGNDHPTVTQLITNVILSPEP